MLLFYTAHELTINNMKIESEVLRGEHERNSEQLKTSFQQVTTSFLLLFAQLSNA